MVYKNGAEDTVLRKRLMEELNIGHTALINAAIRAEESCANKPLFIDPQAQKLTSSEAMEFVKSLPFDVKQTIIVRERLSSEKLATAISNGFRQFLNLGAGMDTKPYRKLVTTNEHLPEDVDWFEVDMPHSLKFKEEMLQNDKHACNLKRVGLDISNPRLFDELAVNGFDRTKKTFVMIEGVMPYLEDRQIDALFDMIIKNVAKGSRIFFTIVGQSDKPEGITDRKLLEFWKLVRFSGTHRLPPIDMLNRHGLMADAISFTGHKDAHYGRMPFPAHEELKLPNDGFPAEWLVLCSLNNDVFETRIMR